MYDGPDTDSSKQLSSQPCGDKIPKPLHSTGNVLTLTFTSDSWTKKKGVSLKWRGNLDKCERNFTNELFYMKAVYVSYFSCELKTFGHCVDCLVDTSVSRRLRGELKYKFYKIKSTGFQTMSTK